MATLGEIAQDLRDGRLSKFRLEQLVNIAARLGFRIQLGLAKKS